MDKAVSIRSLLGAAVRLGNLTIGVVHDVCLAEARHLGPVLVTLTQKPKPSAAYAA